MMKEPPTLFQNEKKLYIFLQKPFSLINNNAQILDVTSQFPSNNPLQCEKLVIQWSYCGSGKHRAARPAGRRALHGWPVPLRFPTGSPPASPPA